MSFFDIPISSIEKAQERIKSYVSETPIEYSHSLSKIFGRDIYLKLENFSSVRVFKIRGAFNRILSLEENEKNRGVITASSGNHGLAVAYAAKKLGIKAVVCVPETVNPQKLKAIEMLDAEVIKHGVGYDDAYQKAVSISSEKKLKMIHAFDDPDVIAGQATCGLEITRQLKDFQAVIVPIGGGGLISGIASAIKQIKNDTFVYGVQTESVPSMYTSIEKGKITRVQPNQTIADGMIALQPGEITFRIVSKLVEKIFLVNDQNIMKSISIMLDHCRMLVEPAGASPLAALINGKIPDQIRKIVLVISGGNISKDLLKRVLESYS